MARGQTHGPTHGYEARLRWTGNTGTGTSTYVGYKRTLEIEAAGKPPILASADPAFRGDADRWNPEEMLLGAIASCHMLWFLHLAADAGLVVESYEDRATAEMRMNPDGSGEFVSATLRPHVTLSAGDAGLMPELHHRAHGMCFIARSLNFEVACEPVSAAAA